MQHHSKSARTVSIHSLKLRAAALAALMLAPGAIAAPLNPLAYSSQGNLSISSGAVAFDTNTLQIIGGGAGVTSTTGVFQAQGGGQPSIAVFDFSNISIGAGATIQVVGSNPVAILSQGNVLIVPAINLSGLAGGAGSNAPATPSANDGQNGTSASSAGGAGGPQPAATEFGGKGGDGGYGNGNGAQGSAGSGGAAGGPLGTSSGQLFVASNPGGNGNPGASGSQAAPGSSGASPVPAGPTFFLAPGGTGTSGSNGTNGKGGGGGGGGGGGSPTLNGFDVGNADRGGGGGSGGNGGRAGNAGGAGSGGGAIEIGAVGSASVSSGISASGGSGGNGGDRALGTAGGIGGAGADDSGKGGNGGIGGDGGYGGPGGAGAGGAVFLHSGGTSVSSVNAAGGAGGTNNGGGLAGPAESGILKLTGTTLFNVNGYTPGAYDALSVAGRLDIDGTVAFGFASDAQATQLPTSATLDTFFIQNGGPVPSVLEFSDVTFTGQSPTTMYAVTLNPDRTFSIAAVPEPTAAAGALLLFAAASTRRQRTPRQDAPWQGAAMSLFGDDGDALPAMDALTPMR